MNENEMIDKLKKLYGIVIDECCDMREEITDRERSICGVIDGMIDELKEETYKRLRESAKENDFKESMNAREGF